MITTVLLEVIWPSLVPMVGTNLTELGVKLAAQGTTIALRGSVKAVARTLLKKSVKKQGPLTRRGSGKKQRKDKKQCPCTVGGKKKKRQGDRQTLANQQKEECVDLQLISVRFLEDLVIHKDLRGRIEEIKKDHSEWESSSLKCFKNEPTGYVGGTQMKVEVRFKPIKPPEKQKITGILKGVTTVKNKNNQKVEIELTMKKGTFVTLNKGSTALLKPITLVAAKKNGGDFNFEKMTQFYNPMEIDWKFAPKTNPTALDFKTVDSSEHEVYVTLDKPHEEIEEYLYLSYLHWAVSNDGATTKKEVVRNTWKKFARISINGNSKPANITTWDGRKLRYYPAGGQPKDKVGDPEYCLTNFTGYGQCDNFAHLLNETLLVNDISHNIISVSTKNQEKMLIKEWGIKKPVSFLGEKYPLKLFLFKCKPNDIVGCMTSPTLGYSVPEYGNLINKRGRPGQNTETPSEKTFVEHQMLEILSEFLPPELKETPYFDPSYGTTFKNRDDFVERVIFGYTMVNHYEEDDSMLYFKVKQTEISDNIVIFKIFYSF